MAPLSKLASPTKIIDYERPISTQPALTTNSAPTGATVSREAPAADQVILNQSQPLLPAYSERFMKDLLANIYYTDPETGMVSGIASRNPLMGEVQYDENGQVIYERDAEGNIKYDAFGEPVPQVIGGVPRPDVMPFTPLQQEAIDLGAGGIGAYKDDFDSAREAITSGISTIGDATGYAELGKDQLEKSFGEFDPTTMVDPYYNQYVEDVIDVTERDIQRQGDLNRNRINASAVDAGAFGGSRQAVAEQENQRNVLDAQARTGAQLRSQAYDAAMTNARGVFENEMARNQTGAQIYNTLGQGLGSLGGSQIAGGSSIGALGEATQGAIGRDVDRLFNLGSAEQTQRQSEYDVQRQGLIEEAYEPFQRFSYMSDIFRGVPSTQGTLTATSAPSPNPITQFLGNSMGMSSYYNAGGTGILSGMAR